ncbi:hypothetical protein [Methanosarcina siciliae]|nr:hypothetical protein [Methanosarcina siciliae]
MIRKKEKKGSRWRNRRKESKIEKRFSYPADYAGCGNKKDNNLPVETAE